MTPRPYQEIAIAEARRHILAGKRAPLIICPTGGGKTCIAATIASRHLERGEGRAVVWLAHRRELVRQAANTLQRLGLAVGFDGLNASAPVQVASVQTCLSRGEAPPGTLAVIDEAHHFVADEWAALPKLYASSLIIGLTATPERADGRGLGLLFDSIVVAAQISDMIALNADEPEQGLTQIDVVWPGPGNVLDKKIAQSPVDAWHKYAEGRSAVVFCNSVQAAKDFAAEFEARGVRSAAVWGVMSADKRDAALDQFADGRIRVLCNMGVLTEGWDAPIAKVCMLTSKVGSMGGYLQRVGRVRRPYRGQRALLIDLSGATREAFGPPDQDLFYDLDGTGIRRAADAVDAFCRVHQIPRGPDGSCPECGPGSRETGTPEVAGVDLVFDKWAHVPVDRRVTVLAGLIRRLGQKNPRAPMAAFRRMFKHWPSREQVEAAKGMVGR